MFSTCAIISQLAQCFVSILVIFSEYMLEQLFNITSDMLHRPQNDFQNSEIETKLRLKSMLGFDNFLLHIDRHVLSVFMK